MSNPVDSYDRAKAVTPHDSNANVGEAFYVGVTGDVAVGLKDGSTVVFKGALAGHVYRVAFVRILSTGTAATDIVALS